MWCQNTQEEPKTCLGEEEGESRELENSQKRTWKMFGKEFQRNLSPWHQSTIGSHGTGTHLALSRHWHSWHSLAGSEISTPRYACSRSWHISATTKGSGLAGTSRLTGNSTSKLHVLLSWISQLKTETPSRSLSDTLLNWKEISSKIIPWSA